MTAARPPDVDAHAERAPAWSQPAIESWLREPDPERVRALFAAADAVRRARVGDAVHLRGLIEISNACVRECWYCGLRAGHRALARYRLTHDEILTAARTAHRLGYGTVVLQAGEDPTMPAEWVSAIVERIKADTGLAVTLSLGERSPGELAAWRRAGADRYLLRLETSDVALFERIHPGAGRDGRHPRLELLHILRTLGYEVGSGVLIGIPGQTWASLAADLALFRTLDLDMIGVGPFIPHPATPLGRGVRPRPVDPDDQVPPSEDLTYRVIALARLLCPEANIPSTTALATLNTARGRELGLERGANVVMPNLTPMPYRALYEIYPGKACIRETASTCHGCLAARIRAIGRTIGVGPGSRRRSADRRGTTGRTSAPASCTS